MFNVFRVIVVTLLLFFVAPLHFHTWYRCSK